MPLRYPWRKPYGAWLLTTGAMLAILLPGSIWVDSVWGLHLPAHGTETLVAVSMVVGLVSAGVTFQRQTLPEPGDLDEPD